ncbi:MAG: YceI family protein [Saprospiraceae bacterium]|nr:YceI family protein [Saprospiraceae bacterium]
MKQMLLLIPIVGILGFTQMAFKPAPLTHKVDLKQSSMSWTGHKVTGKHSGLINLKSGELKFDGNKLVGGSFEIDITSISCSDLSGEYADKLIGHLKSDDFFGAAKYPTAKLVITNAAAQGPGLYKITGDLTLKGTTKPIRFLATVKDENGMKTANAEIKIDRVDFNIKYGSGSFFEDLGDKTIYDEFDLNVKLVTKK